MCITSSVVVHKDDAMPRTVLLIEDNSASAALVKQALLACGEGRFVVDQVRKCSEAQERLGMSRRGGIAAVVANLYLPDSQGLQTIARIFEVSPHIPILVLTNSDHEHIAKQAVQRGAQDYVLQHRLDNYLLPRLLDNMLYRAANTEALFAEMELAQLTLNSMGDGVISVDAAGNVIFLNRIAEVMTGWPSHEALGRAFNDVFRIIDSTKRSIADPVLSAVHMENAAQLVPGSILIRRDGVESPVEESVAPIRDRMGDVLGAVIVFRKVPRSRAISASMPHSSPHDCLTGLPSRSLLNDRLSQAIASGRRDRRQLAVLFIDIDRFEHVNDSLGHAIGDQLLMSVAGRLIACVRATDTVSRQGGDEFVVLLAALTRAEDAILSARKILASLSMPHFIEQHNLQITASIGIGVYPDDGTDAATLLKNSGQAMLNVKQQGRNSYGFFKPHMNEHAIERRFLESGLRHALDRQEFVLYYQPQMDLQTKAVVGAEALIRWCRPKRGMALPSEFMTVAEQSGYLIPIGLWVLREACRQARSWLDACLTRIPVAINISAIELLSKGFVESVRAILQDTGLEPYFLELEVTEIALVKNIQATAVVLHALKAMGVQLALDHFGTGASSLTHLKRFPVDALKIDRSLVHGLCTCADDASIVNAVIGTGKSFHLRIIADGVETREQFLALQNRQCTEGQGHYFREPMPAGEFAKLLEADLYATP
jgi:diguanylate cyclase (GGDEF)-like protein/PAS domain S-box-containing protein